MSNVSYNLGNHKPLINREQTYVLDRKLITIHSEDRDITKWNKSSHFEIVFPEPIYNVQSLRLIEVAMPANLYTFSNKYQNTLLAFTLNDIQTIIKIDEGFYNPNQLALELTNKMNQAVGSGMDTKFNVYYNNVSQKLWFGHTSLPFSLDFSKEITYNFEHSDICSPPIIFNQYTNWGLPSYLGFDKKKYYSEELNSIPKKFDYLPPTISAWTDPTTNDYITYAVESPSTINIMGDRCIYMDVEKYNTMDELYPYTQSSKDCYNFSGYSGKVNSAFAKIPINSAYDKVIFDSRTLFLNNFAHYDPPIERIAKLKFTFRFHDGRLVDFNDCPFDFTLEFNCLKNEIGKAYNVRVPHTYLI
jgi:hypothetical protein